MREVELIEKLRRLEATEDARERNALAIELSDTHDPRVFEPLVKLIERPDLVNSRGTLIYSLASYDCSSVADLLRNLVATGNFEVRSEAQIILDRQALD